MKEFKNIISEYDKLDLNKREVALATVVKVRGSSYRSPGARMLICDDGKWVGSISGGCLEGDALRKARQVMQNKLPLTVTYDTREESNQNLGIGLGCNGVIDVFIEPIINTAPDNPISRFKEFINKKEAVALASIFNSADGANSKAGEKILVHADEALSGVFNDDDLQQAVRLDLIKLFDHNRSLAKQYETSGGNYEVFIELIQPSISLMIFGGGFDARPVSALAKSLGWEVMVTDECVAHIAPVFFPTVDKIALCQRAFIDQEFDISKFTACVLMSHNYEYDRDVLKKIVKTESPYIGMLGPRKRFDKMLEEFAASGLILSENELNRIHSPIGLDIGAETPDEIALSIVSEIQTVFANREGGFLKSRPGPIHAREQKSDQVYKQVYLQNESLIK
jgi:xanthine dehydrogenase accessory factor